MRRATRPTPAGRHRLFFFRAKRAQNVWRASWNPPVPALLQKCRCLRTGASTLERRPCASPVDSHRELPAAPWHAPMARHGHSSLLPESIAAPVLSPRRCLTLSLVVPAMNEVWVCQRQCHPLTNTSVFFSVQLHAVCGVFLGHHAWWGRAEGGKWQNSAESIGRPRWRTGCASCAYCLSLSPVVAPGNSQTKRRANEFPAPCVACSRGTCMSALGRACFCAYSWACFFALLPRQVLMSSKDVCPGNH